MMPCGRMESISSCSASRPKSLRGCSALGTIFAKLIWWIRSPDSLASGRVATEGVPINAPRPLPRPDRAMWLRLREQFHQRKQQSALARGRSGNLGRRSSECLAERFYRKLAAHLPSQAWILTSNGCAPFQKKFEKNVLTPKTEIWYHAPLA